MDCGFDCEVIDLHRPVHDDYIFSKRFTDYHGMCKEAQRFHLKKFIRTHIIKKKEPAGVAAREAKFTAFNGKIRLSRPYRSIDDLYAEPPAYDVYVTGSDQVWNPTQPFCIEPYFLTFVKDGNARKISYASSIGIESLTEREQADFKRWLGGYDVISVREAEGKALLEKLISKEVAQVADPTFLLGASYWQSIAKRPNVDGAYILCFKLYAGNHLVEYAAEIARRSGRKVIVLPEGKPVDGCEIVYDAGPEDYLGYIANADMLISDSFHANVFGILLGTKNQWAYISPDNKRGSRIVSLFKTFGLSDHFIRPNLSTAYSELDAAGKDLAGIGATVETVTLSARNFLLEALRS